MESQTRNQVEWIEYMRIYFHLYVVRIWSMLSHFDTLGDFIVLILCYLGKAVLPVIYQCMEAAITKSALWQIFIEGLHAFIVSKATTHSPSESFVLYCNAHVEIVSVNRCVWTHFWRSAEPFFCTILKRNNVVLRYCSVTSYDDDLKGVWAISYRKTARLALNSLKEIWCCCQIYLNYQLTPSMQQRYQALISYPSISSTPHKRLNDRPIKRWA